VSGEGKILEEPAVQQSHVRGEDQRNLQYSRVKSGENIRGACFTVGSGQGRIYMELTVQQSQFRGEDQRNQEYS